MVRNLQYGQSEASARLPLGPWRRPAAKILDFLLPPLCLGCQEPIDRHGELCPPCWASIDFIVPPRCDRLGIPLPYGSGAAIVSAAALANPPDYDRARAVAAYGGAMRQLIHGLKFRDRHEGLHLFARWLAATGGDILSNADLLVPVPLYRLRLWSRRFNQSASLGRGVAALTGLESNPFSLVRTRATASQVGLTIEQRKRNVAGAFSVPRARRPEVSGRRIVLIDDVITTGATASACAKALGRAGARGVDVLALARVVDPFNIGQ